MIPVFFTKKQFPFSVCFLLAVFFFSTITSCAQTFQPVMDNEFEINYNTPERVVKISEGHYFIDFGKAFFGTVEIRSKRSQKDSLVVHFGEKLASENQIDREPGGNIRYQKTGVDGVKVERTDIVYHPRSNKVSIAIFIANLFIT